MSSFLALVRLVQGWLVNWLFVEIRLFCYWRLADRMRGPIQGFLLITHALLADDWTGVTGQYGKANSEGGDYIYQVVARSEALQRSMR
jgi:hypothetical protein